MHDLMVTLFKFIKSFWQFMKIVIVFCIIMLLFYWVENLTGADWGWLNFIRGFLDGLVKCGNSIYSGSLNLFGALFEFKFFNALVILVIAFYLMNLFIFVTENLEDKYDDSWRAHKKNEEKKLNKALQENVKREEKKINKYSILIHTAIKKKFSHRELKINIDEQNQLMKQFITEKTGAQSMNYDGGFLYQFNSFAEIDSVLDILFKVLEPNNPLDCVICIQAGDDLALLKKVADLKYYGKITMAADTAYRYRFNSSHRYGTSQIGIFQNGDKTIEVHEFKEIL